MKSSALPFGMALLVLAGAVYGGAILWRDSLRRGQAIEFHGASSTPDDRASDPEVDLGPELTEFTLEDSQFEKFTSAEMAGEIWVASFFFTACPGECVLLNRKIAELQKNPAFAPVHFLSISCDPDTDTPATLSRYAAEFDADPARWKFCRGPLNYVQRIGRDFFRLPVNRKTHRNSAAVIDAQGRLRGSYDVLTDRGWAMINQVLADCMAGRDGSGAGEPPPPRLIFAPTAAPEEEEAEGDAAPAESTGAEPAAEPSP